MAGDGDQGIQATGVRAHPGGEGTAGVGHPNKPGRPLLHRQQVRATCVLNFCPQDAMPASTLCAALHCTARAMPRSCDAHNSDSKSIWSVLANMHAEASQELLQHLAAWPFHAVGGRSGPPPPDVPEGPDCVPTKKLLATAPRLAQIVFQQQSCSQTHRASRKRCAVCRLTRRGNVHACRETIHGPIVCFCVYWPFVGTSCWDKLLGQVNGFLPTSLVLDP